MTGPAICAELCSRTGAGRPYRVIAPDLRGYGRTEKPARGYDKQTMARDIRELMRRVGVTRAAVVGHDRVARVAARLAKDRPDAVSRLVVMGNIPTRITFERMDARGSRGRAGAGLLVLGGLTLVIAPGGVTRPDPRPAGTRG